MSYYAAGAGQGTRERAAAFELIRNDGGARTAVMAHVLYLPQAWNASDVSGDTLRPSAPGKHFVGRRGWVMSNYQLSGRIHQGDIVGSLDGKLVTGESVFKGMKDLWDIHQAKGRWRAGPDSAFLPGGETSVPLDNLEIEFTNLDEPESDGRAGEGVYRIFRQPSGGFTYRREAGTLFYHYAFSFVCLELSALSDTAKAAITGYAKQFEDSYAAFAADANWAFAVDAGQRLLADGLEALEFREAAKAAMKSKPWNSGQPVDIPAGAAESAMAAMARMGAGA